MPKAQFKELLRAQCLRAEYELEVRKAMGLTMIRGALLQVPQGFQLPPGL